MKRSSFFASMSAIGIAVFGAIGASADQKPNQVSETYKSWQFRCVAAASTQSRDTGQQLQHKTCELNQTIRDTKGNPVARIAFGIDPENKNKLVAVFQVPQGVLLTAGLKFGTQNRGYLLIAPYLYCAENICIARQTAMRSELQELAASGETGILELSDVSGRSVKVLLSLDGFASALARIVDEVG